ISSAFLMQQAPTSAQSVAAALKNPKTVEGKAISLAPTHDSTLRTAKSKKITPAPATKSTAKRTASDSAGGSKAKKSKTSKTTDKPLHKDHATSALVYNQCLLAIQTANFQLSQWTARTNINFLIAQASVQWTAGNTPNADTTTENPWDSYHVPPPPDLLDIARLDPVLAIQAPQFIQMLKNLSSQ
ncbi:hypothetical protein PHLCEN_2v3849, partial [Hermanssonia centrifuga]